MKPTEIFLAAIKNDMTMVLATAADSNVSMRVVSPVLCDGNVLIFTARDSKKYMQLEQNPNCCIYAGGFFAEATAILCGSTMQSENARYREQYSTKFPGAFDEGVKDGGRDADFVMLKLKTLSGWAASEGENDLHQIQNMPFSGEE